MDKVHKGVAGFLFAGVASLCLCGALGATQNSRPTVGIRQEAPGVHALVDARIVVAPGKVIERGSVVIRDGRIEAVGSNVTLPDDARIWDSSGFTLYPGLIESYAI